LKRESAGFNRKSLVPSKKKDPLFALLKPTPFTNVDPVPPTRLFAVIPEPAYDLVLAASRAYINPLVTIPGECDSPI
jgi:hypothetical protein